MKAVRIHRFGGPEVQLANVARLIDSGQVRVTVAKVFDLDEAVEAHRFLEEGHLHGKVVLKIDRA